MGQGDGAIVPDLIFVASPNTVEMTGAKPWLVDIEWISLHFNLKHVKKLFNKKKFIE